MMDIEYNIGDWVYSTFSDKPCRLTGIRLLEGDYADVKVEGVGEWKDINSLTPIPLTDEILRKNGFKYHNGEVGMFGVTTASYYMLKDSPFRLYCDGQPYAVWFEDEVDIKYVHQLQHVLGLCKIEKEIVL